MYFIQHKEDNIRNISRVLMFQQFLHKDQRLRDSMSGGVEVWHWSQSPRKQTKKTVQKINRARFMAARLTKKKETKKTVTTNSKTSYWLNKSTKERTDWKLNGTMDE